MRAVNAFVTLVVVSMYYVPSAWAQSTPWRIKDVLSMCTWKPDTNPPREDCASTVFVYNSQTGQIYMCEGSEANYQPSALCHKQTSPITGPIEVEPPRIAGFNLYQKQVDQINPNDKWYWTLNANYYWVAGNGSDINTLYYCIRANGQCAQARSAP
jgi:hypothetical protein